MYALSERVTFTPRYKQESESVTQFLTALRGLAGSCDFWDNLEERLRDQLVGSMEPYALQLERTSNHG